MALGAGGDQAEVVAQPLHVGARRQHDRLGAPRQRAAVGTRRRSGTCRARCAGPTPGGSAPPHTSSMPPVPNVIFARPGVDAALADERRLLVADEAGDRWAAGQRRRLADDAADESTRSGSSAGRDAEEVEDAPVPLAAVDGEEAGDGGVGVVRDVQLARRSATRRASCRRCRSRGRGPRRPRRGRAARRPWWRTGWEPARGRARRWRRCTRRPCAGPASRGRARSAHRWRGPTRSCWPAGW